LPVFHTHLPANRFSSAQKKALGAALPIALNEALQLPVEDQFVIISEHQPDELFLNPTYMGMERSEDSIIISVLFTAERPLTDKRAFTAAACRHVAGALGIAADDVFIALMPVPRENFSFGRGELQLAPAIAGVIHDCLDTGVQNIATMT
jgi:hypothetical protein